MNIYKFTVFKITTRGKEIEVYQNIIKSDLTQGSVYDVLRDRYFGLSVKIEEIKEIEELKSNNGSQKVYSFENMYDTYFRFSFNINVDNEKIEKMRGLKKEMDKLEENLKSDMSEEVLNNPKYSFIREVSYNINVTNTYPASISGMVRAEDVKLKSNI